MRSQLLGTHCETYIDTGFRDRRCGAGHPRRLRRWWVRRHAIAHANSGAHRNPVGNPHPSADRGAHRDAHAVTHRDAYAHARPVAVRGRSRSARHRFRSA